MKAPKLHLTDLLLLRDFFAPGTTLHLTGVTALITGDEAGMRHAFCSPDNEQNAQICLIEIQKDGFQMAVLPDTGNDFVRLDYINNPDGSMRWFYPDTDQQAGHLRLYNSSGFKATVYKTISRAVCRAGFGQLLASGHFKVQQNLFDSVKKRYGIAEDEALSFFTGTRGVTRKMVIEVHKGPQAAGFIKAGFSPEAKQLIENEYVMVQELNKYDFTSLSIPKVSKRVNGHTRLSNIKPAVIIPADRITAIHIRALAELYSMSHEKKAIADTECWQYILTNMDFLSKEIVFINNLDRKQTDQLIHLLQQLFHQLPATENVPVSVSHGDFTPWNMYCDEQRLYVYDWEMARNGIPMFFDLFHFTYQSQILQHRNSYAEVKTTINQWTLQPLVQQLVKKYRVNLSLHHALYLLFNVSHYLRQYLAEKEPLLQSQWMMNAWTGAIADYLAGRRITASKL